MQIDQSVVRAHVMRPANVLGIRSSKGLEDTVPGPAFAVAGSVDSLYYLDVSAFGSALHAAQREDACGQLQ